MKTLGFNTHFLAFGLVVILFIIKTKVHTAGWQKQIDNFTYPNLFFIWICLSLSLLLSFSLSSTLSLNFLSLIYWLSVCDTIIWHANVKCKNPSPKMFVLAQQMKSDNGKTNCSTFPFRTSPSLPGIYDYLPMGCVSMWAYWSNERQTKHQSQDTRGPQVSSCCPSA